MDNSKKNGTKTKSAASNRMVAIGTGLVALDVVFPHGNGSVPFLCSGGTCGNVLTVLSFLGWQSFPVARLRSDAASRTVAEDLKQWSVALDFVTMDDDGSTPVVIQHIRRSATGESRHSFSRRCPNCGTMLPWYKAVRSTDVSTFSPQLPQANVFFFDRVSRGALQLAEFARAQGALVVFEPSASSEPHLLAEALELADIVKISSDRVDGNEGVLEATQPTLLIETQGAKGLRFRVRSGKVGKRWYRLPSLAVENVKDTAGAGDWCTAGIIYSLAGKGPAGLKSLTVDEARDAIRVGQAMASWTCSYHGARGGMYESSCENLWTTIHELLDGFSIPAESHCRIARRYERTPGVWCECCVVKMK